MLTRLSQIMKDSVGASKVAERARQYLGLHDESAGGDLESRNREYASMVNAYYDLVTDFYEYGWGQSFHFAPRHPGENFAASLARHEMYLASRLGLKPGMKVADIGCGVGGPMRAIARFSGSSIVGINNNDYQIKRGRAHNERAGLDDICDFLKCDFMNIDMPDGSVDAAYAIEATCHAPDKEGIYSQIYRILKPGGYFAAYEWCLTDRYDANDDRHRAIKKGIEVGDSLPDLYHTSAVDNALKAVGFELLETHDAALDSVNTIPWWYALSGKGGLSLSAFRSSRVGRRITHTSVNMLEKLKVAPKGSGEVSSMLMSAAEDLIAGGETGIFTPMYFMLVRKPLDAPPAQAN